MNNAAAVQPMVSVLVTTYQHGPFIAACLDSILAQRTTFPFEVLVGEDGSTDGTREVCERYAAAHPGRIRLFLRSRKDVLYIRGQATGRNNLIALLGAASGRYIALCEGDDLWTDVHKLQRQVDLMEADPSCAGCFHNTCVVDDAGATVKLLFRDELPPRIDLGELPAPQAPFHTSSFVFRNYPWLKQLPALFLSASVGDLALFALVAGEGPLRNVDGTMSAYRKHGAGITTTALHAGPSFHVERMRLWMLLDGHFPARMHDETTRVCNFHWTKVRELCKRGARLCALWDLFRSVPMWFVVRPRIALHYLRSVLAG